MPPVKIRRDELEIVKQAAIRVERRSSFRFVMDHTRIEVTDEESSPSPGNETDEPIEPKVVFD